MKSAHATYLFASNLPMFLKSSWWHVYLFLKNLFVLKQVLSADILMLASVSFISLDSTKPSGSNAA